MNEVGFRTGLWLQYGWCIGIWHVERLGHGVDVGGVL